MTVQSCVFEPCILLSVSKVCSCHLMSEAKEKHNASNEDVGIFLSKSLRFSEYLLVIHCPLHQSGQVVEAPSNLYRGYSADSQAPRLKTTRGPPPLRFHSAYGWSGNQQFAVGFWWIALIKYELIFPLKSLVGFLRIQHSFPSEHAT